MSKKRGSSEISQEKELNLLVSEYKYQNIPDDQVLKVTPYNSCAGTTKKNWLAYLGENNFGGNSTFKSGVKFYTDKTPGFVVQKIKRTITNDEGAESLMEYYELFYISCQGVVSPKKCESFEADDFVLGEDITHSTPEGKYKQIGNAVFYPFAADPPITKEMMDGVVQYTSLLDKNIKIFLNQFKFGDGDTPAAGLPYSKNEPSPPQGIISAGKIIRVIEFNYGEVIDDYFQETFIDQNNNEFELKRFDCDTLTRQDADTLLTSLELKTNCSLPQKIKKICNRVTQHFSAVTLGKKQKIAPDGGGGGKKTRTKKQKKKKNKSKKRRKKKNKY
jgi:hypothetical protein